MLDVLVEDEQLHASSDLAFGGRVSVEPHIFAHFRGTNLEAHSRSWLQLAPRQTSASWLHIGAYGLIVSIVLLGVCMPLRDVWHSPAQPEHRETNVRQHAQRSDGKGAGRYLLQSIARLDDEYESGGVDADTYQQRRQACKEQLYKLVEELQSNEASQKALETWGRAV
jgi:hypothetical protein